jgi:NADPH-dependent ferric siderophore reductase
MNRVVLTGPELEGFAVELPAASVRLLIPSRGSSDLVIPSWNGNEFLLPGGERPTIRTFTPRRVDPDSFELDLEIVLHPGGRVSEWARSARPGDPAAISGPGRGYSIAIDAPGFLLAGDETALPAIGQLLEALPPATPVRALIEIAHPEARRQMPAHPRATVEWLELPQGAAPGDALLPAVAATEPDSGVRVWAAGEAAAMQRIRRHLFEDRGLPRPQVAVRGYWKHGR